jgi:hypothetical protein
MNDSIGASLVSAMLLIELRLVVNSSPDVDSLRSPLRWMNSSMRVLHDHGDRLG